MAATTAMDIALSLARDRRGKAEQALAAAQAEARQAGEQCLVLTRYRDDYLGRLRAPEHTGIAMLMNMRAFIARLDLAVESQQKQAAQLEAGAEQARLEWTDACRREKSIEVLMARRQAEAATRALRTEQKLTDEFAARAARRLQAA